MKAKWIFLICIFILLLLFFPPYTFEIGPVPRPESFGVKVLHNPIQDNMVGMTFVDAANKLAAEVEWTTKWGEGKQYFHSKIILHSDVGKSLEELLIKFCEEDSTNESIVSWKADKETRQLTVFLKIQEAK